MPITKDEFKNKIIELNTSLQTDRKALPEQLLELINLLDQEDLHEDFAKLLSGEFVINSINNETFNLIAALSDYVKTRDLFPLAIFSLLERMESLGLLKDKLPLLDPLMEHLDPSRLNFVFNTDIIQKMKKGDFSGWQDALNPATVLGRCFSNDRLYALFIQYDHIIFEQLLNAFINTYETGSSHPNNILASLQMPFQVKGITLNLSLLFGQRLSDANRLKYLNLLMAIANDKKASLDLLASLLTISPIETKKDKESSEILQNLGLQLCCKYPESPYEWGTPISNFLLMSTYIEILEILLTNDLRLSDLIQASLKSSSEKAGESGFVELLYNRFPSAYDLIHRLTRFNVVNADDLIKAGYSQKAFANFLTELAENLVKDKQKTAAIDVLRHALNANNELGEFFLRPEKGKSPSIENASSPLGKLYQCLAKLDIESALTCKKSIEGAKAVEFLSKLKTESKTEETGHVAAKTAVGTTDKTMLLGLLAKGDDEDHPATEAPAKLSITKSGLQ